jgi:hypothetical protein
MIRKNDLKIFIDNGNDSNPRTDILRRETHVIKYLCIAAVCENYIQRHLTINI